MLWRELILNLYLSLYIGAVNGMLIEPYFFPPHLNDEIYLDFLRHNMPYLLEDFPLNVRQRFFKCGYFKQLL